MDARMHLGNPEIIRADLHIATSTNPDINVMAFSDHAYMILKEGDNHYSFLFFSQKMDKRKKKNVNLHPQCYDVQRQCLRVKY